METEESGNSEMANSTVSMLISLAYFVAVCWVVPIIPAVLGIMYSLPSTIFLALWVTGSLFIGLASHHFFKEKND